MIKGLTLVEVFALRDFTKTTRHGNFHGDPNGNERARNPLVPDYVVEELVASGRVALLQCASVEALVSPAPPPSPVVVDKRKAALAKANAARAAKRAAKTGGTSSDAPVD
jgi:hypothetical protein